MAEKLIKMFKDGKTLEVHPTCVGAHQAVGWLIVGGPVVGWPVVVETVVVETEKSVKTETKVADNDTIKKPAVYAGKKVR